jgi:NAD(P)H-hydrate epimerase
MCISDLETDCITSLPAITNFNAIAIGPGIGSNSRTQKVVEQLLNECTVPLVIDADAINILAVNKNLLSAIKPNTILTPHIKEFERLTKKAETDFERLQNAIEFAKKYNLILVLKGAHTAVINSNGEIFFNSTGNPSLAKGGSGDMLTGIIAANLAKGYKPLNAAILGVFRHGQAADICVKKQNMESILASDLIEALSFIA